MSQRVVVVAGGGSGIGAATALRLATGGDAVVVGDLDAGAAADVVTSIEAEGGTALAVEFDIADAGGVESLVAATIDAFGHIDGVHVNAADLSANTIGRDSDVVAEDLEVFDRTIAVNLRGHVLVTRQVVPLLLANGGGSLVYTSSAAAFIGDAQRPAYSMAKAGLGALVRHVAARWGKERIRANAVAPGYVITPKLAASGTPELQAHALSQVRSHRLGKPEDIAAAVAFLMSDEAEWITGQVISVDGGATTR